MWCKEMMWWYQGHLTIVHINLSEHLTSKQELGRTHNPYSNIIISISHQLSTFLVVNYISKVSHFLFL